MNETQQTTFHPFEDPAFYPTGAPRADHPAYKIFKELQQANEPYYYEPLDVYILTRFDDIRSSGRRGEIFSSGQGLFLNELRMMKDNVGAPSHYDGLFPPEAEHFAFKDGKRHRELRGTMTHGFAAKSLMDMRPDIEQFVTEILDGIEPGKPFDFIERIGDILPTLIAGKLLGLPRTDVEQCLKWADALEAMNAAETPDEIQAAVDTFHSMNGAFTELIAEKRDNPGNDLISALIRSEVDGAPLSFDNILAYSTTILAAGSDTTRGMLTGMTLGFADHPDQWQRLRDDRSLLPKAIEEGLRWATPARSFVRTLTEDAEIGTTKMKKGQRVFLLYAAGNFDESVFSDPFTFDIGREQKMGHLAFGFGAHTCIAAALVRMETEVLYSQMLDRYTSIERAGDATPVVHVLRHSWYDAPIMFNA